MEGIANLTINDVLKLVERNERHKAKMKELNLKNGHIYRQTWRDKLSDDEYKALKSEYNKTYNEKKKLKKQLLKNPEKI